MQTKFNIGDEVEILETGEVGVVIDILYSHGTQEFRYVIKSNSGKKQFTRVAEEIASYTRPVEYTTNVYVEDGKVVVVIYEVDGEKVTEVSRNHGHIHYDGALGYAQALSFASKRLFERLDTEGLYVK